MSQRETTTCPCNFCEAYLDLPWAKGLVAIHEMKIDSRFGSMYVLTSRRGCQWPRDLSATKAR